MTELTNEILKNAMPKPGKRIELRDDQEPGLTFRVTDKGVRTWSIRYRNAGGEQRRKLIGPYPAIGLAAARKEAKKIKGAVAGGADIVAADKLTKSEERRKRLSTFEGLAEVYFEDAELGTHRSNAKPKRASTIAEEKRIYEKLVKPEFGSEPITDITRAEIQAFVSKQTRKAPSNGRHCRNIIRQIMSYALRAGLVDINPAHDIAIVQPEPRERVLSDEELKAIWKACERPQDVDKLALSLEMGIAIKMAAVTLQRGGEVIGMEWREIDRAAKTWLIPAVRMKGKRPHLVPLSGLALELLDEAKEKIGGKRYVFESSRTEEERPMDRRALSRAMNRVVTALKIDDATPHDLRRTGATNLTSERAGIPRFIVSQVIAHAGDTGGAAAVTGRHYDMNDYLPEKRRALDAWGNLLHAIVTSEPRTADTLQKGAERCKRR